MKINSIKYLLVLIAIGFAFMSCNTNEKKSECKETVVTRFKGLGEISPDEFGQFFGAGMRKQLMRVEEGEHIQQLLEYYMGKNTPDRQEFIINNLKVELDIVEEIV